MRSLFVILNWLPIWADFFLTEIEIHENKIDEKDLKAALNFATHGLSNVAGWIWCSPDQE